MTRGFTSPQGKLRSLSRDQLELIKLLREEESRQSHTITPAPREERDGRIQLPTSWGQQRIWFVDQLEGGSAGYIVLMGLRLRGHLNYEALQEALNALVTRHEVLRTVFVDVRGVPVQQIARDGKFPLQVVELSECDGAELEACLSRHRTDEANEPFDLKRGPLARARLLRKTEEEHVLLVCLHHIIADGWSKGVFLRELEQLYLARTEKRDDPLRPLPIQYGDYSQWQRRHWANGRTLEQQLTYWRSALEDAPPQLELPTDRSRPSVQSYRGGTVAIKLSAELMRGLRALAKHHELTLFMLLYAGFAILLARLSGQKDVLVGTPVANRQRPELEGLIGLFVNPVVLRVLVNAEQQLEEFLRHVKDVTLGAYDHQEVPFEQVVEAVRPQRSVSRNPLFQVMFVLHNWPRGELRLSGLELTLEEEVDEPSILDMWMFLEERADEIVGGINYAADLFDRGTVERWVECWLELLKSMTRAHSVRIGELSILPQVERSRLMYSFNAPRVIPPRSRFVHHLFEEQARRTPDAIAIVCGEEELTYRELSWQSSALAKHLVDEGVTPGGLVAVYLERSAEMIVSLLAVLKVGGAYVPLDPIYPVERLIYMIEDSAPQAIVTQTNFRTVLSKSGARIIDVQAWAGGLSRTGDRKCQFDAAELAADQLAYVIYTSGSTGKPKGVMIEHQSVVNLLEAMRGITRIDETDRLLAVTTLAFDIAGLEIYLPLTCGACVVVGTRAIVSDPAQLSLLIHERGITMLQATPATWQMLIESGWQGARSLRALCGGEALTTALSSQIGVRVGALWNVYGPTETTIWSTVHEHRNSPPGETLHASVEPIGKPIANTEIYVLDGSLQLLPVGVVGEIYIGGTGLARGYLNRPDLTEERFIRNPFSIDPQARLYRTGDLGRWSNDGTLEYFGRNDQQIKIRGYRVELQEVEARLRQHHNVKEAAVISRKDSDGETCLVAYVVGDAIPADAAQLANEMGSYLRMHLPEHMVPSLWTWLKALPLTPNGKVDRRALPEPERRRVTPHEHVAPRDKVERALAEIWSEVLKSDGIGVRDNFFALGGHSLLATRVVSRIRDLMKVELPLRSLFEAPTVEQLSSRVRTEQRTVQAQEASEKGRLSEDFRVLIGEMSHDAVLARIAELEKELNASNDSSDG